MRESCSGLQCCTAVKGCFLVPSVKYRWIYQLKLTVRCPKNVRIGLNLFLWEKRLRLTFRVSTKYIHYLATIVSREIYIFELVTRVWEDVRYPTSKVNIYLNDVEVVSIKAVPGVCSATGSCAVPSDCSCKWLDRDWEPQYSVLLDCLHVRQVAHRHQLLTSLHQDPVHQGVTWHQRAASTTNMKYSWINKELWIDATSYVL